MEPLDPTNDEGSGFSKRRLSSILKAPHASMRYAESVQQQKTVECARPVEKRISKRVSFAPDVPPLTEDVKNSSSVRGPLQELTLPAAANPQNRIQMIVTEDGIQQIAGMETLLNAPLHALQQKDKVNFNTGNDFGDKTAIFHNNDACMDMTNCHTVDIANDSVFLEDTLHQNNDVLPSYGEKTLMFFAADGSMDMTLSHTVNMACIRDPLTTGKNMDLSVEKKNRLSALPDQDVGFKNFLANLSKQSASTANPVMTTISPISGPSSEKTGATNASLAHRQTQGTVLDKENQAPSSVLTLQDRSLNTTKHSGESFNRSAVVPDNNISMDITEVQTGCIMGLTDEDNPFQCLFPTQEMYAETENRSQTANNLKTSQQESSKTLGSSTVRAPAITKRVQKVIADNKIADEKSLIVPSLHTSKQRLEVNLNAEDAGQEKTIVFTRDDAFMDMTQSQTINIASVPLAPSSQHVNMVLTCGKKNNASLEQRKSMAGATSANHLDTGHKNLFTSVSTPGGPIGNSVNTTKFPTAESSSKKSDKTDVPLSQRTSSNVTICFEDDVSMDMTEAQTGHIMGFVDTDDPFQSLFPTQDMYEAQQKNNDTLNSSNHKGFETSFKSSLKRNAQNHQVKFDSEEDCRDRTVRFTAEDACMDVTQSCTVNIATDFEPEAPEKSNLLPQSGEKTIKFDENDASMDVTRSHTANIVTDFECQAQEKFNLLPKFGEKTIKFDENDASMDVTRSHTVNIDTDFEPLAQEKCKLLPVFGEKTIKFSAHDASMDVTRSHTVNIATDLQRSHQDLDFISAYGDKTVRFNANDAAMDMTQCLAVNIASNLGMSLSSSTAVNPSSSLIQNQAPSGMPVIGRKTVETSDGGEIGPNDNNDVSMEITEAQTGRIIGVTGSDDALQWKSEMVPHQQRAGLGSSNSRGMDSTLRIPPQSKMQRHQVKCDAEEEHRERTVRFTLEEACMDVTQSHTVNIATGCVLQSKQNVDSLPSCGEKTLKFSADDACMDVTQCHTVNISATFGPPAEKTLRFAAEDACMDVTKSHTVKIETDFEPESQENVNPSNKFIEKTVKCHANDAPVDLKHSATVITDTDLKPKSFRKSALFPRPEERTLRFTTDDAAMDMTQSLTVNIGVGSDIPQADSDILPTTRNMDPAVENRQRVTSVVIQRRSSLAHGLNPAFKPTLSRTSGPCANPVVKAADTSSPESDTKGSLGHFQTQHVHVDTDDKLSSLVSDVMEKPLNENMKNNETLNKSEHCQEDDVSMDVTGAQKGHVLGHTFTDLSQCVPMENVHPKVDDAPSQDSSEASGLNHVEFNNPPNSLDSDETRKDHEERNEAGALPKESNNPADQDITVPSHKSRRMSLADIQSKVRRLSQMINSSPDDIGVERSAPHSSQLEKHLCKNSDKTKSLSEVDPDLKVEEKNFENITQVPTVIEGEQTSTLATPFNLKTKQLMSRLSVSGFKPKLSRKRKPDPKKADSSLSKGELTKTIPINVPNLSSFDHDVSDIYDEELGNYEDVSETLDMRSPQKDTERPLEFNIDVKFGDDVCEEDTLSTGFGKKRSLLQDKTNMESEKRRKESKDVADMGVQSEAVECDGNITAAPSIHTNDSSTSGHTGSMRCEATFESMWKQSLFESQIEDYASDTKMKFNEGTLTVLEFFKLFNIDFVIHNPRQSVLPGRVLSDTDLTPLDLLKDRHISLPKQLVYEANVQSLTEQVEGLKVRMQDLDKPLNIVNRTLWEEMANFSETELKAFGAKLKERNNFFRKMSKARSHEMKEVLYSDLVQVNLEEQNKLRAKIEEADEMIKSLDDCIQQIETDLAAVEDGVKSHQEELKKVTDSLADADRNMLELEMQNKQNMNKVNRLKDEAKKFESHIAILHMINEWKLGEKRDNCTVYTFLHETLHLELVYEKANGNSAENEAELPIANISFKRQLDDEKSEFHACFVHLLVSQYTTGETDWVKKYPTSKHVPQLLHDVSLVVSRCRLLGEELHRLKLWGSMRFDILDFSCTGTEVHIVFSSLKAFSKFEVVFSICLNNCVCVIQVQSFRNIIGSTTIQQIEEIVASFTPANNVFTKIVNNIHSSLLC